MIKLYQKRIYLREVITDDGTITLKNDKYNECYHSIEGAVTETLYKHIYPAFGVVDKKEIKILDICFGLGYNTFLAILNRPINSKLKIYSPEFDGKLVKSLKDFKYPQEFEKIKYIIDAIAEKGFYKDEWVEVEVFVGDAREYIKKLDKIDIVFQDAFSPKVNQELWTIEYFRDIERLNPQIITTYSVATPIRFALYNLGYNLYTHPYDNIRKGTLASKKILDFPSANFEEKLTRVENPFYYEDKNL
jgi:tRNA U34 5-methylaminomethyl-2-thiouridine-forming methyltransferase MnmC